MTFPKMLSILLKHPNKKFRSVESGMYQQDLDSIKYWFCIDKGKRNRASHFTKLTKGTDRELEVKSE